MPGPRTELTEIVTALGTLGEPLRVVLEQRPSELLNVTDEKWRAVTDACAEPSCASIIDAAFENGLAFHEARDGLRGRRPLRVEWKGHHRVPGDDVIPADIRVDHVYQISCKYLSRILQNCGPSRLFDRNLIGERRSPADWFNAVAPDEYQSFYSAVRLHFATGLPRNVTDLSRSERNLLKGLLQPRVLPEGAREAWAELCSAVSAESASRWRAHLADPQARVRTLWRLLRIGDAPYYILGAATGSRMRLRVASAWDWLQDFELRSLSVEPRVAGQPEVAWAADVLDRAAGRMRRVDGHVEIRWSHGRFQGSPEAKIYLDTPHSDVPGFYALV